MYAIEAPADVSAARGGLLTVANVIDGGDTQLYYQGPTYQESALTGHNRPVPAPGTDKEFDQVGITEGITFQVYRGVEYSMFQRADAEPTVREAFGAGEDWAVERAVQEQLLNGEAADITPVAGTPVTNVKQALGLLQQYAADQYSGLPLLHANRYGTEVLSGQLELGENWTLTTKQGTPIANGGGYSATGPGGAAAPDGAFWVYVTGQVNIWRGALEVVPAPALKANRAQALAEATYAASVDSFTAAILVGI
jgi:hypothetical protein